MVLCSEQLSLSLSLSFSLDVLKFDNSYSWTRSKEVFYSVKVLPPNSELSEATPTQESGFDYSDSSDEEFFESNERAMQGKRRGNGEEEDGAYKL